MAQDYHHGVRVVEVNEGNGRLAVVAGSGADGRTGKSMAPD